MYISQVKNKISLTIPELARLVLDYSHMIVEVNGQKNFQCPTIPLHERQIFHNLPLSFVLDKLLEKEIMVHKKDITVEEQFNANKQQYRIPLQIGSK